MRQKGIRDAKGNRDVADYPCNVSMVCHESVWDCKKAYGSHGTVQCVVFELKTYYI